MIRIHPNKTTIFELIGDFSRDKDGELYSAYDLHLDVVDSEQAYHQDEEMVSSEDGVTHDENPVPDDKPAVKVLSEKSHAEVLKMVDDFRNNQKEIDHSGSAIINLSGEFSEILSLGGSGLAN